MHTHQPTGNAARELVQRMGEAANKFLASLSTDQRAKAQIDFADETERTAWHYFPILRRGLHMGEMDRNQERFAQQLVASGLSREGWDNQLRSWGWKNPRRHEGWVRQPNWWRDADFYFVTISGNRMAKALGLALDGHHVVSTTRLSIPDCLAHTHLLGSNPGESPLIGKYSIRPLAGIEYRRGS